MFTEAGGFVNSRLMKQKQLKKFLKCQGGK